MEIQLVDDEACPTCGAFWGHPNAELDFPNRTKVCDSRNVWWWRCYNPKCSTRYYDPETGRIEKEPTEDEAAEQAEWSKAYAAYLAAGSWVGDATSTEGARFVPDPNVPMSKMPSARRARARTAQARTAQARKAPRLVRPTFKNRD